MLRNAIFIAVIAVAVLFAQYHIKRTDYNPHYCGAIVELSSKGPVKCYEATVVSSGFPFTIEQKIIPKDTAIVGGLETASGGVDKYTDHFVANLVLIALPIYLVWRFGFKNRG